MIREYKTIQEISGPLMVVDHVPVSYTHLQSAALRPQGVELSLFSALPEIVQGIPPEVAGVVPLLDAPLIHPGDPLPDQVKDCLLYTSRCV